MEYANDAMPAQGMLLVASPDINESFLYRSVILLCDHSSIGSFGLIVNKPIDDSLAEEIDQGDILKNASLLLRAGGPMQPEQMMLLHTDPSIPEQTLEVCSGVYLGGDVEFLQANAEKAAAAPIFLCFGYMGWSGDLLEKEFLNGFWYAHPASQELLFDTPASELWKTTLKQMGGKYAKIAMIPDDLSLN